jgi:hypothetical protein
MTKKLLLELPDDVHAAVKSVQIDRAHVTREKITLNDLLIEVIITSKPVNRAVANILKRAAAKKKEAA